MGMSQQGPWVLCRGKAASHGSRAEAQEGLATWGAHSFGGLCQGQLMVVERGLELRRRAVGPPGAVRTGAGELFSAETSCRSAAPQQGRGGLGVALHPRELGRRRAVGNMQQSERCPRRCPKATKGPVDSEDRDGHWCSGLAQDVGSQTLPFSPPHHRAPQMLCPPHQWTPALPPPSLVFTQQRSLPSKQKSTVAPCPAHRPHPSVLPSDANHMVRHVHSCENIVPWVQTVSPAFLSLLP